MEGDSPKRIAFHFHTTLKSSVIPSASEESPCSVTPLDSSEIILYLYFIF